MQNFRDTSRNVGIGEVINKKTQAKCKLTLSQRNVLFQRISYELHTELYSDDLNFILCEDRGTIDNNLTDILDITCDIDI